MATCAVLGQALGTAVAMVVNGDTSVEHIDISELQKQLAEDDCFIPGYRRKVSALSQKSVCNSDTVRNGIDRGEENCWIGKTGDKIEYVFDKDTYIQQVRLIFDSNLNRNYHNMPCNYPLVQERFKLPETLIKEYIIEGTDDSGKDVILHIKDNHQRFVVHDIKRNLRNIRFVPLATHGCTDFRVFNFEIM